jgi:dihydrofolate reductase
MGFNTWKSIGKPLPKRLNIFLSRSQNIENQPEVLLLRSVEETLALSKYLNCDLFVIGGAETYKNFANSIEKWIVTEVPEIIENADTFMPKDFLDDFVVEEVIELENNLQVKIYSKK